MVTAPGATDDPAKDVACRGISPALASMHSEDNTIKGTMMKSERMGGAGADHEETL